MNQIEVIDLLIGIFFLISVFSGFHRGFVIMLARIIATVVSYGVAAAVAAYGKTTLGEQVILPMLSGSTKNGELQSVSKLIMPQMAEAVASALLFFVVFFVLQIVLSIIVNKLKIIDHIPVVGIVNKLGGAVVGFFWIGILVFILGSLFFGIMPQASLNSMGFTRAALEKSVFLQFFATR